MWSILVNEIHIWIHHICAKFPHNQVTLPSLFIYTLNLLSPLSSFPLHPTPSSPLSLHSLSSPLPLLPSPPLSLPLPSHSTAYQFGGVVGLLENLWDGDLV